MKYTHLVDPPPPQALGATIVVGRGGGWSYGNAPRQHSRERLTPRNRAAPPTGSSVSPRTVDEDATKADEASMPTAVAEELRQLDDQERSISESPVAAAQPASSSAPAAPRAL